MNHKGWMLLSLSCMMLTAPWAAAADVTASMAANPVVAGTASSAAPASLPSGSPSEPPALTRELIDLIQAHKLVELRTIYNASFAAAMFFDPQTLRYYTALLKGHTFWWINKTASEQEAENMYTKLATQTIRLAAPELAKIQLDARIAVARKRLEEAQTRQANLMQQITTQNSIVQEGTAAQARLAQEAAQLNAERARLQQDLAGANSAIESLQQQTLKGPDIGGDAATGVAVSTPAAPGDQARKAPRR